MKIQKDILSNYLGIASASLCVVHCIATPFLMLLLSNSIWLEKFSYIFLLVSFYSAFQATEYNSKKSILYLMWGSFTLLSISLLFEDDFAWLEIGGYIASLGLIIGHILNVKYCEKCKIK